MMTIEEFTAKVRQSLDHFEKMARESDDYPEDMDEEDLWESFEWFVREYGVGNAKP